MNRRYLCGVVALLLSSPAGGASPPASGPPAAISECGACHMVYPPRMLPQRSWAALLGKLDAHFGEVATLTDAQRSDIAAYLAANAADGPVAGARGQGYLRDLPAGETPLRITDMPWWNIAHQWVDFAGIEATAVKSASNCNGCHQPGTVK